MPVPKLRTAYTHLKAYEKQRGSVSAATVRCSALDGATVPSRASPSEMREIMRQRGDFLVAQGIGDIRHRGPGAAGSHARFVVVQRLDQIFLALAGDAGDGFGAGKRVGVA